MEAASGHVLEATAWPHSLRTPKKKKVSWYFSGARGGEVLGAAAPRGEGPDSDIRSGLPRGFGRSPLAHHCWTQPSRFLRSCAVVRLCGVLLMRLIAIKSQRAGDFSYSFHQRAEVLSQSINVRTHFTW